MQNALFNSIRAPVHHWAPTPGRNPVSASERRAYVWEVAGEHRWNGWYLVLWNRGVPVRYVEIWLVDHALSVVRYCSCSDTVACVALWVCVRKVHSPFTMLSFLPEHVVCTRCCLVTTDIEAAPALQGGQETSTIQCELEARLANRKLSVLYLASFRKKKKQTRNSRSMKCVNDSHQFTHL